MWRTGNACKLGARSRKFFFVTALIGRAVCNAGFVERPLVIGFAWWVATGDIMPALPLAIFFELFWLDLYPLGGFIPPMPAFPYLLLLFLSRQFHWDTFSVIVFPLVLSLPFAYVVPLLEKWQRNRQKSDSLRMLDALEHTIVTLSSPGRVLLKAIFLHLGPGFAAFAACCFFMSLLASLSFVQESLALFPLQLDWPALYLAGAIGAIVGLRVRRVYMTVLLAALAVALGKLFL